MYLLIKSCSARKIYYFGLPRLQQLCEKLNETRAKQKAQKYLLCIIILSGGIYCMEIVNIVAIKLYIRFLVEHRPSRAPTKYVKTSGDDEICPKLLKITRTMFSHLLFLSSKQSMEQMYLPADWRFGEVLPIFKSGHTNYVCNYRPIFLTNIPCKTMEHIIYVHAISYLCNHHLICPNQHGSRKGVLCETQLL